MRDKWTFASRALLSELRSELRSYANIAIPFIFICNSSQYLYPYLALQVYQLMNNLPFVTDNSSV